MLVSLLRLLGALGGAGVTFFVGSVYSESQASTFFVQYSTILLGAAVFRFGFEDSLLRFVSGGGASLVASGIIARVVGGVSTLLIALYVLTRFSPYDGYLVRADIEYFLIPVFVFMALVASVLQGLGRFKAAIFVHSLAFPFVFLSLNAVRFSFNVSLSLTEILVLAALFSFFITTLISLPNLLRGSGIKKTMITPVEQGFFYMNSMLGAFGIHGVILLADRLLSQSDFVDFSLILRMCQIVSVFVVVMNFTFAPKARALFVMEKHEEIRSEYLKTIWIGFLLSLLLTIVVFLVSFTGYTEFRVLAVLEFRSFWIVWSAFCLNLILGCIGYLYIMTDLVKVSSLVGCLATGGMISMLLIMPADDIDSFAIIFASFSILARVFLSFNFFKSYRAVEL